MEEKKGEIENRFQLLITMSLFFPILLSSLGTLIGQSPQKATLVLIQTSVVVGLYLVDYILFQIRKPRLGQKALEHISTWLLVAVGVFVVPILGITLETANLPTWVEILAAWLSGTSMLFILALPPIIEFVLIFSREQDKK